MAIDYRLTEEDYKRAEMHGVSRVNLYNRYEMLAWDLERAITQPVLPDNRKYSKELLDRAAKHGVSYSTLAQRIQKGIDEETAATMPVNNDHWSKADEKYLIEHNEVLTAQELAERLNKTVGAICGKRHRLGLRKRK